MNTIAERIEPRSRLWAVLAGIAVLSFQALMLYPLHESMDLPMWDESNQMGWGAEFAAGSGTLRNLSSSPLYNLLYAVLTSLFGRIPSIFAAKYLLTIGTTLLLYVFLVQNTHSWSVSFLLAALWSVSRFNLSATLLVYHFALALFLLALLLCNRSRPVAIVLLLLCALARLEYLLVLVPYCLYCLLLLIRRGGSAQRPATRSIAGRVSTIGALVLFSAVAVYTSLHIDGWNVGGKRSWHAFRQYYAVAQVEAGRATVDPWVDYGPVIARDFPGSHSTLEAMSSNPRAFALHVAGNLRLLPGSVLRLFEPYRLRRYWPLYLALLVLLLTAPLVALLQKRVRFLATLKTRTAALGDVALLALLASLTLLPGLMVRPKSSYSLPLLPLLTLFTGIAVTAALCSLGNERRTRRSFQLAAIVACAVVGFAGLTPRPFDRPGRRRPVYEKVMQLETIWPATKVRLLGVGASWYANYLGTDRCVPIEPLPSVSGEEQAPGPVTMGGLIRTHRPGAVLINRSLLNSSNFQPSSLSALDPEHWVRHRLGDEVILLAKVD